jgi:hypothetical protein
VAQQGQLVLLVLKVSKDHQGMKEQHQVAPCVLEVVFHQTR